MEQKAACICIRVKVKWRRRDVKGGRTRRAIKKKKNLIAEMDGGEVRPRKPQSGEEKMDIMKSSEEENPMMRPTFTISEQHFLATIHQLTGGKKKILSG